MTQASPFKTYKIRINNQDTWHEAMLTRNTWNAPWTGTFLAYDQHVAEITEVVALYCIDCQALPFSATRLDIDAAGGHIVCEYCGKPCVELTDNCVIYRKDGGLTLVENFA